MRAYVSGLDIVKDRYGDWRHKPGLQPARLGNNFWHDAGVRLRGPSVGHVYDFYRALYNGQIAHWHRPVVFQLGDDKIPSHYRDTPAVPKRDLPAPLPNSTRAVQVLETIPRMHVATLSTPRMKIPTPGVPLLFTEIPGVSNVLDELFQCLVRLISGFSSSHQFDPDGYFGFATAVRKAISQAECYIYIEDQSFSSFEEMQWINQRLKEVPTLKVILAHGFDPADPKSGFMYEAVNRYLLDGIDRPSSRVSFWEFTRYIIVHSKVTIIDDEWVAIGSANMMRRSLFTDGECSISIVGPGENSPAKELRIKLWGEHCGLGPTERNRPELENLDLAMGIWQPHFGHGMVAPTLGSKFIQGVDTNWTSSLVHMKISILDDPRDYVVIKVDVGAQRLELDEPYSGPGVEHRFYNFYDPSWPNSTAGVGLRGSAVSAMADEVGPECLPLPFTMPVQQATGSLNVTKGKKKVELTGSTWAPNELKDRYLHVIGEPGWKKAYKVVSNDATSATLFTGYDGPSATGRPFKVSPQGGFLIDNVACFEVVDRDQKDADSRLEY
jgi:hypothetical protein